MMLQRPYNDTLLISYILPIRFVEPVSAAKRGTSKFGISRQIDNQLYYAKLVCIGAVSFALACVVRTLEDYNSLTKSYRPLSRELCQ